MGFPKAVRAEWNIENIMMKTGIYEGLETPGLVVREEEMIRLFAQGLTIGDVALHMGISLATVRRMVRRRRFLDRLKEYSEVVYQEVDKQLAASKTEMFAKRLEEAAEEALEQMILLAKNGASENIKFKASQDLLDREIRTVRSAKGEMKPAVPQINIAVLQQAAQVVREEDAYRRQRLEEEKRLLEMPTSGGKAS